MKPLVRILLRHGISFKEFSEVVKAVYVDVASHDFQIAGKKQTLSRIAIITGLTRKEVGRIAEILQRGDTPEINYVDRVSNVLGGWHQDPDFTGPYGIPRELEFDSDQGRDFAELVKRYSGDMPARAMLEELLRVKAVEQLPEGMLQVRSRSYVPLQVDPSSMEFMGLALRDLAETLDHNLNAKTKSTLAPHGLFERRVWAPTGIPRERVAEFDALVRVHGQEFLERLDNWLTRYQLSPEEATAGAEDSVKAGVGIYLFANTDHRDDARETRGHTIEDGDSEGKGSTNT
jgi:hypothetical protein